MEEPNPCDDRRVGPEIAEGAAWPMTDIVPFNITPYGNTI